MQNVAPPSEIQGAVLQNLATGIEDDVVMEPAAPDDNIRMESDETLGHAEPDADDRETHKANATISAPAANLDSGMEDDAVFQNLQNMDATNWLGNSVSEGFIHQFQRRGFKVVDFKSTRNIYKIARFWLNYVYI